MTARVVSPIEDVGLQLGRLDREIWRVQRAFDRVKPIVEELSALIAPINAWYEMAEGAMVPDPVFTVVWPGSPGFREIRFLAWTEVPVLSVIQRDENGANPERRVITIDEAHNYIERGVLR